MVSNDLADIHIGQFLDRRTLPNGQKMGTLSQSIHDDPNGIQPPYSLRQLGDKIHQNVFLFPHGNLQRLQLAMRPLVLGLDHPTGQAPLDIPADLSLHARPLITQS